MDSYGNSDGGSWKYCQLCNIKFTSRQIATSHAQSALHKKNESKLADATKRLAQKNAPSQMSRGQAPAPLTSQSGYGDASVRGSTQHALQPDCKACKVGGFRVLSLWNEHVEGRQHCTTILRLFYSLEHEKFLRLYGDVPYSKNKDVSKQSEYAGDIEKHMAVRSGILNYFECRLCNNKSQNMRPWMSHITGKKHIMNCVESVRQLGLTEHMNRYGDIPLPRGGIFEEHLLKFNRQEEIEQKPLKNQRLDSRNSNSSAMQNKLEERYSRAVNQNDELRSQSFYSQRSNPDRDREREPRQKLGPSPDKHTRWSEPEKQQSAPSWRDQIKKITGIDVHKSKADSQQSQQPTDYQEGNTFSAGGNMSSQPIFLSQDRQDERRQESYVGQQPQYGTQHQTLPAHEQRYGAAFSDLKQESRELALSQGQDHRYEQGHHQTGNMEEARLQQLRTQVQSQFEDDRKRLTEYRSNESPTGMSTPFSSQTRTVSMQPQPPIAQPPQVQYGVQYVQQQPISQPQPLSSTPVPQVGVPATSQYYQGQMRPSAAPVEYQPSLNMPQQPTAEAQNAAYAQPSNQVQQSPFAQYTAQPPPQQVRYVHPSGVIPTNVVSQVPQQNTYVPQQNSTLTPNAQPVIMQSQTVYQTHQVLAPAAQPGMATRVPQAPSQVHAAQPRYQQPAYAQIQPAQPPLIQHQPQQLQPQHNIHQQQQSVMPQLYTHNAPQHAPQHVPIQQPQVARQPALQQAPVVQSLPYTVPPQTHNYSQPVVQPVMQPQSLPQPVPAPQARAPVHQSSERRPYVDGVRQTNSDPYRDSSSAWQQDSGRDSRLVSSRREEDKSAQALRNVQDRLAKLRHLQSGSKVGEKSSHNKDRSTSKHYEGSLQSNSRKSRDRHSRERSKDRSHHEDKHRSHDKSPSRRNEERDHRPRSHDRENRARSYSPDRRGSSRSKYERDHTPGDKHKDTEKRPFLDRFNKKPPISPHKIFEKMKSRLESSDKSDKSRERPSAHARNVQEIETHSKKVDVSPRHQHIDTSTEDARDERRVHLKDEGRPSRDHSKSNRHERDDRKEYFRKKDVDARPDRRGDGSVTDRERDARHADSQRSSSQQQREKQDKLDQQRSSRQQQERGKYDRNDQQRSFDQQQRDKYDSSTGRYNGHSEKSESRPDKTSNDLDRTADSSNRMDSSIDFDIRGSMDVDLRSSGRDIRNTDCDYRDKSQLGKERKVTVVGQAFDQELRAREDERLRQQLQQIKVRVHNIQGQSESLLGAQHQDTDYRDIAVSSDLDLRMDTSKRESRSVGEYSGKRNEFRESSQNSRHDRDFRQEDQRETRYDKKRVRQEDNSSSSKKPRKDRDDRSDTERSHRDHDDRSNILHDRDDRAKEDRDTRNRDRSERSHQDRDDRNREDVKMVQHDRDERRKPTRWGDVDDRDKRVGEYGDVDSRPREGRDHRDKDDRIFGEAAKRAKDGVLDKEVHSGFINVKDQNPNLNQQTGVNAEVEESINMFAETVQQFLSMVCNPENAVPTGIDSGAPEAQSMVHEVCQLTGVQDLSIVSHAVNILSSLDPVIVQTLGMLPPETLQQFMQGNVAALSSRETLKEFKEAIAGGKVDIKALQSSIMAYNGPATEDSPDIRQVHTAGDAQQGSGSQRGRPNQGGHQQRGGFQQRGGKQNRGGFQQRGGKPIRGGQRGGQQNRGGQRGGQQNRGGQRGGQQNRGGQRGGQQNRGGQHVGPQQHGGRGR